MGKSEIHKRVPALEYEVSWRESGEVKSDCVESARQACKYAKSLIDAGNGGVEIRERSGSILKSRAILDFVDIINGNDLDLNLKP